MRNFKVKINETGELGELMSCNVVVNGKRRNMLPQELSFPASGDVVYFLSRIIADLDVNLDDLEELVANGKL